MRISEPAEYGILGLLLENEMHGYEMFQRFQSGVLGQIVHIEMSQLYAFLKKLERLALVEADLEQQGVRPPRKMYRLTPKGLVTFQQWLIETVERPRDIRIFFLLKLCFVQQHFPEKLAPVIEQQIVTCERFLASLKSQQRSSRSILDPETFDQIILSSRIYQTDALLEWLHELQGEFAQSY